MNKKTYEQTEHHILAFTEEIEKRKLYIFRCSSRQVTDRERKMPANRNSKTKKNMM